MIRVDDMGFTHRAAALAACLCAHRGACGWRRRGRDPFPSLRLSARRVHRNRERERRRTAPIFSRAARAASRWRRSTCPRGFEARFATRERSYSSANVLAVLPGTDPALADEPVLLIAHLDGYGYGTPVNGDNLYNGALDDAAYVATLITFADARRGRGFRRPVIFAAVTGRRKACGARAGLPRIRRRPRRRRLRCSIWISCARSIRCGF